MDSLANEVRTSNSQTIRQQILVARRARVSLIAYEGGQHLVGHGGMENNQQMQQLFHEANRHPRLEEIYTDHFRRWFATGGGLYAIFSNVSRPTKWGSWGILEYQDQPLDDAPKMRAVMNAIKNRKLGRRQ